MHYENEKFASSTTRMIAEIAHQILKSRGQHCDQVEQSLLAFMGIDMSQLNLMVSYIVGALPYKIYLEQYNDVKLYLQFNLINKIIALLLQDSIDSQQFSYLLENIKHTVLFELMNKMYVTS